ncbi:hypothetical protein CIK06_28125 [Plantactinospora sp. KBS50]|nr:nucleotide sugar dehydrogenase [Plantactinospora sp. KBS50]ASW57183.1 hypothetical protein CIK06_28125 [Plantactinospora sp. KBS50]
MSDNSNRDGSLGRFRRAVLTGGGGFVGSYVAEQLLAAGVEVFCVDNFSTGHPSYVERLLDKPGFTLLEADVTEEFEVPGKVDLVLHLASPASIPEFARLPIETMLAGSAGTYRTLQLAHRHGARYVLASTSEIYGDPQQHPQSEEYWGNVNPIGARSVYDEAKRYAEAMTVAYGRKHGVSVGIARIFNSYGPLMRPDGRVISGFVAQAVEGLPLLIHGDGTQTRSPCFVEDTARGILAIAASGYQLPVNIGNTEEISVLDLARTIREIAESSSPIRHVGADEDDPRQRCPDIGRAKRELGWEPRVPLAEGLRRTVEAKRLERQSAETPVPTRRQSPQARGGQMHVISVVGCGYLGVTHAAGMAELGHEVIAIDIDAEKIKSLADGRVPFFEPGLDELVGRHLASGRLRFTGSYEEAAAADIHFICVGTPQRSDGSGADLRHLDAVVEQFGPHLDRECLVVGKSTVPVGTAARLATMLHAVAPAGDRVSVAWNPEFLSEGRAVADTLRPDRLVLGTPDARAERLLREVYAPIIDAGVPVVVADLPTAEVIKSAANSFMATKLSFINAISEFCEASGADIKVVTEALAYDARIGGKFFTSGLGFGGGCVPKDIRALLVRAGELGVAHALAFLAEVDAVNMRCRDRVVELLRKQCGGSFAGRRIAVLGAAFKPGTDDIRDSPALHVANVLHGEGGQVAVYDPRAMENARRAFPALGYEATLLEAVRGADVVALLTDWEEFALADPQRLAAAVGQCNIVDARHLLDADAWQRAGWTYLAPGRPGLQQRAMAVST